MSKLMYNLLICFKKWLICREWILILFSFINGRWIQSMISAPLLLHSLKVFITPPSSLNWSSRGRPRQRRLVKIGHWSSSRPQTGWNLQKIQCVQILVLLWAWWSLKRKPGTLPQPLISQLNQSSWTKTMCWSHAKGSRESPTTTSLLKHKTIF